MAKLQPGQSRFEIPASGEDEANARAAYAGLVFVWIAEGGGANLRHAFHLAPRSQTLATRRSAARRGSIEAGPAAGYANAESANPHGRFWMVRKSPAGLCKVAEGDSPNNRLYETEKRPNSQKPCPVAICVTVVFDGSAPMSARRARCIRRSHRYRMGPIPRCSSQQISRVRSEAPTSAQISARCMGRSRFAANSSSNRLMTAV